MSRAPESRALKRWELPAAGGAALVLAVTHAMAMAARPLCRRVFVEEGQSFTEPRGAEALEPVLRLQTWRAWQDCDAGVWTCLETAARVADHHHPPVSTLLPALATGIVGTSVPAGTWVMWGWLLVLLLSVHFTARLLAGRNAAWLATGLAISCPALLLPSRLLHVDGPMLGALGLAILATTAWARQGRAWQWPLMVLACGLAVLTKWEASLAIYALLGAAGLLSVTARRPLLSFAGVLVVPWVMGLGLAAWVSGGSDSFTERTQLLGFLIDARPQVLWTELAGRLGLLGDAVETSGQMAPVGTLAQRLWHYAWAVPIATAGLLTSLLLCLGGGLALTSRAGRTALVLALVQGVGAVAVIAVAAPDFVDDRFLQFALPSLCIAAGVGLSRTGLSRIRLVQATGPAVAIVALLMLIDGTAPASPLSGQTLLRLPTSPFWAHGQQGRPLTLRPQAPLGHGSWVRPGQCAPTELEEIHQALDLAQAAGAQTVVLSADARHLGDELWAWELARLERASSQELAPPEIVALQALVPVGSSGEHGCQAVAPGWGSATMRPGTVLVHDADAAIDAQVESCGEVQGDLDLRTLGRIAGHEGDTVIVQIR